MGTASIATVLLDVLTLVQAGLHLRTIVASVNAMRASGATEDQIAAYLRNMKMEAKAEADTIWSVRPSSSGEPYDVLASETITNPQRSENTQISAKSRSS